MYKIYNIVDNTNNMKRQSTEYKAALEQRQETMSKEGIAEGEGAAEEGGAEAAGGGLEASEAAEAEALAGVEAAESAMPGLGEALMGITAIGGAIYGGIIGEEEKKAPTIPAPPPMPKMPQMANVAFASAPTIDSAAYHNL